jgi:hypothetical protein
LYFGGSVSLFICNFDWISFILSTLLYCALYNFVQYSPQLLYPTISHVLPSLLKSYSPIFILSFFDFK